MKRERQTTLFRKMQTNKGWGGGAGVRPAAFDGRGQHKEGSTASGGMIAVVVGVLVVVVILILVMAGSNKREDMLDEGGSGVNAPNVYTPDSPQSGSPDTTAPPPVYTPQQRTAPPTKPKKDPSVRRTAAGQYVASSTYEYGAREQAIKMVNTLKVIQIDSLTNAEFEELASKGRVSSIVDADAKFISCIINAFISEDKTITSSAWQAMHNICKKHNISASDPNLPFNNPIRMDMLNSAIVRAGQYNQWTDWLEKPVNREVIASWDPGAAAIVIRTDPKGVDWGKLMQTLRAGGAFDDLKRPEGLAYQKVRSMGRSAYPHLLGYIDDEDTGLGRAAVAILNELTGRDPKGELPNENTKSGIKNEWEHWLKDN